MRTIIALLLVIALIGGAVAGCERKEEGTVEKAGKQVDRFIGDVKKKLSE